MSDWSEHYVVAEKALGELRWLLPEAKWGPAKEKAILIEQSARALIEAIKRHQAELEQVALKHSNAQILTPMIYAYIPITDAVGVDGGKATSAVPICTK